MGAVSFCLLNVVMLRSCGPMRDPTDVVRVFVGFVAAIAGMIAMGALIALTISMFQKGDQSDTIKMTGSWCFFYLTTYVLTTRMLARNATAN